MNRYWLADSLTRVRTPNVFLQLEFSPSAPTRTLAEYPIASPFRRAVTPNCPFDSCLTPRNDVDSCRTPPLLDNSSLTIISSSLAIIVKRKLRGGARTE